MPGSPNAILYFRVATPPSASSAWRVASSSSASNLLAKSCSDIFGFCLRMDNQPKLVDKTLKFVIGRDLIAHVVAVSLLLITTSVKVPIPPKSNWTRCRELARLWLPPDSTSLRTEATTSAYFTRCFRSKSSSAPKEAIKSVALVSLPNQASIRRSSRSRSRSIRRSTSSVITPRSWRSSAAWRSASITSRRMRPCSSSSCSAAPPSS
jgi:hypothetical protein